MLTTALLRTPPPVSSQSECYQQTSQIVTSVSTTTASRATENSNFIFSDVKDKMSANHVSSSTERNRNLQPLHHLYSPLCASPLTTTSTQCLPPPVSNTNCYVTQANSSHGAPEVVLQPQQPQMHAHRSKQACRCHLQEQYNAHYPSLPGGPRHATTNPLTVITENVQKLLLSPRGVGLHVPKYTACELNRYPQVCCSSHYRFFTQGAIQLIFNECDKIM